MPRLFLHIREGHELVKDPEGTEFDNLTDARREAILAAREMMSERVRAGRLADGSSFEIADEAGTIVLVVPFRAALVLEGQKKTPGT